MQISTRNQWGGHSGISPASVVNQSGISTKSVGKSVVSKRGGKPGKSKWIISEWIDLDSDDFWLTIIAVVGWGLLLLITFRS